MESNLITAILVDGSRNPPALRVDKSERREYIAQGRPNAPARNFRFVRPVEVKVEGETEARTVYVYKLVGGQMSDEQFERLATAEVDKHLNPEKYMRLNESPEAAQAELDEYRRRFGPLAKEG